MQRAHHRKSRFGCERCKKRKVKCDELKPRCTACQRHHLECSYQDSRNNDELDARGSERFELPTSIFLRAPTKYEGFRTASQSPDVSTLANFTSATLEARLLHYFVSETAHSISTAQKFWTTRVPLMSFEYAPISDLMMALAALHVTREQQHNHTADTYPSKYTHPIHGQSFFAQQNQGQMRSVSESYFQRGVQAHRIAVGKTNTDESYESTFVTSLLISIYSLFMLGDVKTEALLTEGLWFRLAVGPRELAHTWMAAKGQEIIREYGISDDEPNLHDDPELTNKDNAAPFKILLETGRDFELIGAEDEQAYEGALMYIGLMYRMAISKTESSLATCRRLLVLPSFLSPRFGDMVLREQHRALTILCFAFAVAKLIEDDIILLRGVADNQIRAILMRLPAAWKRLLGWPEAILDSKQPPPPLFFDETSEQA